MISLYLKYDFIGYNILLHSISIIILIHFSKYQKILYILYYHMWMQYFNILKSTLLYCVDYIVSIFMIVREGKTWLSKTSDLKGNMSWPDKVWFKIWQETLINFKIVAGLTPYWPPPPSAAVFSRFRLGFFVSSAPDKSFFPLMEVERNLLIFGSRI